MHHLQLSGTYSLTHVGDHFPPSLETHAAVLAADEQVLREVLDTPPPEGPWERPAQVRV